MKEILDEICANSSGRDIDDIRREEIIMRRLEPIAKQIIQIPACDWPKLNFNWDLSDNGRCYSFDRPHFLPSEKDRKHAYRAWRENLLQYELRWFPLDIIDRKLSSCCFREVPWVEGGSDHRLAQVIAHVSEGHPISPIVVSPNVDDTIFLAGGNHRYTAAKFSGQKMIPVYLLPEKLEKILELLELQA